MVIVGGDFNPPRWDWSCGQLRPGTTDPRLHHYLLDMVQELGLEQLVKVSTRLENTLDLLLTNYPHLVSRVETILGLSDHDGVYVEFQANQQRRHQAQRPMPLYNKADWSSLRGAA